MSAGKIERSFEVRSYETDPRNRMRADCVQNKLQELAYIGSQAFGASYFDLRERGLFWVLNRMHIRLLDTPVWGDKVDAQTWSRGMFGPLYHRNFLWRGKDGRPLLAATSAWSVLDLESRSIKRESVLADEGHVEEDTFTTPDGAPQFCGKVAAPRDLGLLPAGEHSAAWTDLDTNAHVNNCTYLRWALDLLGFDYLSTHSLRDIQICYFHEIHPGQTVRFLSGTRPETLPAWKPALSDLDAEAPALEGEAVHLEGRVDDTLAFSMTLFFQAC